MLFFEEYKFLIVPGIAWFIAQFGKLVITLITEKRLQFSQMVSMGGMPSSHSSTVTALAITLGKIEGWNSPIFAFSVIFALIVMYDAGGVRKTVGSQSVVLNKILNELFKGNEEFEER
ncbi:MAG TPA: divergent PAP2 family protein, partial [Dehalococcoidia bacterium]|nr:divergent PAP2 family protein [Dehalococcoidia bacterium]